MRKHTEARFHSFYERVENCGLCVYCGQTAGTVDHFVPLSVRHALDGIIRLREGLVLLPACRDCNLIAGGKLFKSVGAKRRYIQRRLCSKHRRTLAIPDWNEEEVLRFGRRIRETIRKGLARKAILLERIRWRNGRNPAAVKIAAIHLRL